VNDRPFTPARNAEPAEWLVERLTDFAVNVMSIIPSGFEAYARVFHPASKVTCTADGGAETVFEPLRWSEVAELAGRTPHKLMQWPGLQGASPSFHDYTVLKVGDAYVAGPEEGGLPLELAQTLWPIFGQHTKTPYKCFFAIWEGFGFLPRTVLDAPAFEIPARKFHLFAGPLEAVEGTFCVDNHDEAVCTGTFTAYDPEEESLKDAQEKLADLLASQEPLYQSANLWWPQDHAWCVHTEIDFSTTYVAGSQALVDAILESDLLEAYQVEPTDKITYDSDTLNPTPDDPYGGSFKIE